MMENDAEMVEPSSLVADGIPFHTNLVHLSSPELIVLSNRNQTMSQFPCPSTLHSDNNLGTCGQGTISDAYPTENVQPERSSIGEFLYGPPNPMDSAEVKGRYMEGMPLCAASVSNLLAARCNPDETLNKYAPLAYPFGVHRNINPTVDSNALIDNVPARTSTKWDSNNFATHPEPVGKDIGMIEVQPFGLMQNMNPEVWVASQSNSLSSDSPGSSRLSNELSLSLATSNASVLCRNFIQDHCSEICGSNNSPYERCLASEQTSCSRNLTLSFDSSKPIQPSQFLSESVYINAIQEILAELACYSLGNLGHMNYPTSGIEDQADVSFSSSYTAGEGYLGSASADLSGSAIKATIQTEPMMRQSEVGRKKKHLLALLQVVDDQYSQCLDEIHTVVSAFHAVTELNPDIHARFALHTISFLYKSLRERISNHILTLGLDFSEEVASKEEKSFETSFIQKQWALQQLRRKDNQIWRPQRGLPERSVSVLRAWMFQNFLHPYPKDAEKHLLAVKSGLTRSQVSNWFINARVRLWKPMIEEMYAEMNRRKNRQNDEETNNNQASQMRVDNQRFAMF